LPDASSGSTAANRPWRFSYILASAKSNPGFFVFLIAGEFLFDVVVGWLIGSD